MGEIIIKDFKAGMDRMRKRRKGAPGTLWMLKNAHITRGGDIERCKAFPIFATVPSVTRGLAIVGDSPVVFSHVPVAVPAGVGLQVLAHPEGGIALDSILDTELADGRLYVVARFADGSIYHYYDGARVTDWDTLSGISSFDGMSDVAALLAQQIDAEGAYIATVAGSAVTISGPVNTAFTYSGAVAMNSGAHGQAINFTLLEAHGAASPEVLASASFRVASGAPGSAGVASFGRLILNFTSATQGMARLLGLTVNGVSIIGGEVSEFFETGANKQATINAWGIAIAAAIGGGYAGSYDPATSTVKISGPIGTAYDGRVVARTQGGIANTTPVNFSGGVAAAPSDLLTLKVNGVSIISAAVIPFGATAEATALLIRDRINAHASAPNYTATASGKYVTVKPVAGSGATPNGFVFSHTKVGNFNLDSFTAFSGGVTAGAMSRQKIRATLVGEFSPLDVYTITLNTLDFDAGIEETGIGLTAWLYKSKIYSTALSLLYFTAINDFDNYVNSGGGVGAGFINVTNQRKGDKKLVAAAEFQNYAAVFSEEDIKIFTLNEDDDLNNFEFSIDNTGTIAAHSILPYGNSDLFYLAANGFRSLRARALSNSAYVEDVGTRIDPFVREYLKTLSAATIKRAHSVIEPLDGRYWCAVGDRIFVFTFFPSEVAKISAWSFYEPGFAPEAMAKTGNFVYLRALDKIYLYGGLEGDVYPGVGELPVEVSTPFLDAEEPSVLKTFEKMNVGIENEWSVSIATNSLVENEELPVAEATEDTFTLGDVPLAASGHHISVIMRCAAAGRATISDLTITYTT